MLLKALELIIQLPNLSLELTKWKTGQLSLREDFTENLVIYRMVNK